MEFSSKIVGVVEGLIWEGWGARKVGTFIWSGIRDYRYGVVILVLLEHLFVREALIKIAIPLLPLNSILRHKFI